uniref:Prolamin_like domain-containing protein n=1 Tax=Steinernema glaseri TaxID=37863 RepID=A0A1I8AH58_9BILA
MPSSRDFNVSSQLPLNWSFTCLPTPNLCVSCLSTFHSHWSTPGPFFRFKVYVKGTSNVIIPCDKVAHGFVIPNCRLIRHLAVEPQCTGYEIITIPNYVIFGVQWCGLQLVDPKDCGYWYV